MTRITSRPKLSIDGCARSIHVSRPQTFGKAPFADSLFEILGPPDVAQELGDVVTVTDPITGATTIGRFMELRVQLDRERGLWKQILLLGTT